MAALKQKHILEAQEEQITLEQEELRRKQDKLRREKEQLALAAELKETNAKLEVLESISKCGSKTSNGMNSYLERSKTQMFELNPNAEHFVPSNKSSEPPLCFPLDSQVVTVKPKPPMSQAQFNEPPGFPLNSANVKSKHFEMQPPTSNTAYVPQNQSTQAPNVSNALDNKNSQITSSPDILNIMQRQNEITALLVQQNTASALPMRNIPVFDGDPLYFKSFLRAFENCVEEKNCQFQ